MLPLCEHCARRHTRYKRWTLYAVFRDAHREPVKDLFCYQEGHALRERVERILGRQDWWYVIGRPIGYFHGAYS